MKSMSELSYQYPGGFWACDECDAELYEMAEAAGFEYVSLDIQYINDLSVAHCTRCDYETETGLYPVLLAEPVINRGL